MITVVFLFIYYIKIIWHYYLGTWVKKYDFLLASSTLSCGRFLLNFWSPFSEHLFSQVPNILSPGSNYLFLFSFTKLEAKDIACSIGILIGQRRCQEIKFLYFSFKVTFCFLHVFTWAKLRELWCFCRKKITQKNVRTALYKCQQYLHFSYLLKILVKNIK